MKQTQSIQRTMQKLSIKTLQQYNLQDATRVLSKSFISSNPVWKHYNLQYDDIIVLMRGKLIKALQINQTYVLYEGQRLIGVTCHLDMLDYVKFPSMPSNLQFFNNTLSKVGDALEGSVDLKDTKRGEIMIGVYGVIDPDYASKGYAIIFWWMCLALCKAAGWKTYYCRSSNIYSRKGLERLGAVTVKEYELVDADVKEKFWLVKMDVTKPAISYSMLKQIMEEKKEKKTPKPKL